MIFHTDSAKAYKLKLPNVVHDSVVHQKNAAKKGEVAMDQAVLREDEDSQAPWWQAPQSQVRNLAHITGVGNLLRSFWRRAHMSEPAGSMTLNRKIRSAKYEWGRHVGLYRGASLFLHVRSHHPSFVSHQKKFCLVCSCWCFCLLPSVHLT